MHDKIWDTLGQETDPFIIIIIDLYFCSIY